MDSDGKYEKKLFLSSSPSVSHLKHPSVLLSRVAETAIDLATAKEPTSEKKKIVRQESRTAKADMPTQGGISALYLQWLINDIRLYGVPEQSGGTRYSQPRKWNRQSRYTDQREVFLSTIPTTASK